MQLYRNISPFTLLLLTTLTFTPLATHAMDAQSLLHECIPDAAPVSYQSKIEVHVTHKNAPEGVHHFVRLEDGSGMGLLFERQGQQWLYDAKQRSLSPLSVEQKYPEWMLSESLLIDATEFPTTPAPPAALLP